MWIIYVIEFLISGKLYKGILSNKQHVAVKHIVNCGHAEMFLREVCSLSHVRHPNLVPLLGYCENEDEFFLVYEICPNGNLSEWLFSTPMPNISINSFLSISHLCFIRFKGLRLQSLVHEDYSFSTRTLKDALFIRTSRSVQLFIFFQQVLCLLHSTMD